MGKIKIKKPLHQSIYAIDPNLPRDIQRLQIELDSHSRIRTVNWLFDGREIKKKESKIDWVMEKGKHSIKASVELHDGQILETEPIEVTVL